MTQDIIIIKNSTIAKIKEILNEWMPLYSDSIPDGFNFELCKLEDGRVIVKVVVKLNDDLFFYLVNYLCYPEKMEDRQYAEGFRSLTENGFKGDRALIYIPEEDTDYDNVYVVTDKDEVFKVDFGGKVTAQKSSKTYQLPEFVIPDNSEKLEFNREIQAVKKRESSNKMTYIKFAAVIILVICFAVIMSTI